VSSIGNTGINNILESGSMEKEEQIRADAGLDDDPRIELTILHLKIKKI
jgi:hypothetical protein